MLTRRQLRIKVMQCIYALIQSREDSLDKQQQFLKDSIANSFSLYLLNMSMLRELHQRVYNLLQHESEKYVASIPRGYPQPDRLSKNRLLNSIAANSPLAAEIEKRKLNHWYLHQDYVKIIYTNLIESELYDGYMRKPTVSFEDDRVFLVEVFRTIIAPNDKIYDFFEGTKLTWVDDIPLVNTYIIRQLKKISEDHQDTYFVPKILKDKQDMTYAKDLLAKTLLKNEELEKEITGKTPNWDKDRIADIDSILLKMAICEFLYFPSIPERVTINEYLEIAKEYSTPKSSIFINGILDKLVKEYKEDGRLKKVGRGLL
ncbi:MAG: transcription antitermination factor NusB [Flavobacteriaceae bacterium]|nr:transcription antitermination factor NusB [Flavobacteriaceae bacterium]